ncbi:MAG: hypothetical protein ABI678_12270 [Kofleriaceae bacterium]
MAANEAHVLSARLALVDRIRAAEVRLARSAQAEVATDVMREHLHGLGNAIQIVDLASAQLAKHTLDDPHGLVGDLRSAASEAHARLSKMLELAQPPLRKVQGAVFAPTVRAAVDIARPALHREVDVRDELLASEARCRLDADELELLAIATLLDAEAATKLELVLRERSVEGRPWFELIRCDDRPGPFALDPLPPRSLLAVVAELVKLGGGELSLAAGRSGHELVIALPAA